MQDDTYNGMFIPKGTMVFANAWYASVFASSPSKGSTNDIAGGDRAMAMDTRVYHEPETFKPERFLPGPHGDPEQFPHASFGFGRRSVVLSSAAVPQPL